MEARLVCDVFVQLMLFVCVCSSQGQVDQGGVHACQTCHLGDPAHTGCGGGAEGWRLSEVWTTHA